MQFLETEIRQITEWIWYSMLRECVIRHDHHPSQPLAEEGALMGCVWIRGDWEGAVTLHCSSALARQVAALMFGIPEECATFEDEQDALGELVNMVGGNLKSLLPAPNCLSLPVVKSGINDSVFLPDGKVISKIDFEYMGEPFFVVLLKNKEC